MNEKEKQTELLSLKLFSRANSLVRILRQTGVAVAKHFELLLLCC